MCLLCPGTPVSYVSGPYSFAERKSPKKGRPQVCDPCAALRGKPASVRLRSAPWNSLRADALRSNNHGGSVHEACALRRACHPATAPPQAQPQGVGAHTGHRCARPGAARRKAPAPLGAERSDGPWGCSMGSLLSVPRSAAQGVACVPKDTHACVDWLAVVVRTERVSA